MTATSSQRLNLRPTSRSMPTSSKPQAGVQRPRGRRRRPRSGPSRRGTGPRGDVEQLGRASSLPMPRPWRSASHVHRVLDRRPVGGPLLVRRQRGEADDRRRRRRRRRSPRRRPIALGQPRLPGRSSDRGTRSNVAVECVAPRGCRSARIALGVGRPRPAGCVIDAAGTAVAMPGRAPLAQCAAQATAAPGIGRAWTPHRAAAMLARLGLAARARATPS